MHRITIVAVLTCAFLAQARQVPLAAQAAAGAGAPLQPGALQLGTVVGRVVSAETGQPVPAATVRLLELGRGELTHQDGSFHFGRLAAGTYTVSVQRLGFAPRQQAVLVPAGDTARVEVSLEPSAIAVPGVVVTGTGGRARSAQDSYRPTTVLDDSELRRRLAGSVAATLANQPGISQRYNGPAASQPVIRGLSGDRVLVLEDGARTGDIAATSSDHAVTIEPLTAERVEVLRGPAGLLFGSNALGGVINVVREEVPRTLPEAVTGTLSAQAESVNRGLTAGGTLLGSVGSLAWRAELSGRTASDTRTPLGELPSTGLRGYNGAVGASWVYDAGYVGAAARDYLLEYGVPGTFQGQTIPGAHAGGVTIDLRRTVVRGEAGLHAGLWPFNALEWTGTYTRFEQQELEATGRVGTRFGQLTVANNFQAHHRHGVESVRVEGTVGFSTIWRDFAASGATGDRPAQELSLAGFAFEELAWNWLRLQVGGRYDWIRVEPLDTDAGELGPVRDRDFGAVSGSVAGLVEPLPGLVVGSSISRAFRTPSITELFSNGPHLADYSFNIGNPNLEAEFGYGVDVFARVTLPRLQGEVAAFRNWIDNYIHYAPTGRLDPRLQQYPVYQARGDDARLQGLEGRLQWEVVNRVVLDGNASYVRGHRRDERTPLPNIPPLRGLLEARYDAPRFFASLGMEASAAQHRVGEFERPTDGYALLRLGGGLRWSAWGDLHSLTLQLGNATNEVWYDHLSRLKEVAPQPGRDLQLLYRVSF